MLGATEVIIHILGLAMFIPQPGTNIPDTARTKAAVRRIAVESPPRITVVFPTVALHDVENPMEKQIALNNPPAGHEDWSATVETHTAMIAFRGQYAVQGWTVGDLGEWPAGEKWQYIALSGERLSLQTGVLSPLTSTKLALPHVKMSPPPTALADGYNSPPYSKAAAVLDIRDGVVTPCYQTVGDLGVSGRVDTEITLPTNGQLTISGGTGKSLTLDTTSPLTQVYLANVPFRYAQHEMNATYDIGHYKAYCAMMSGTFTACYRPDFLPTDPRPNVQCGKQGMRTGGNPPTVVPGPPDPLNHIVNFECSNTQWP